MAFSDFLRNWFTQHPFISRRAIETEIAIPNALGQLMAGRDLPEKHWFVVVRALCPYGLELNGWQFSADPEHPGVVFYRKWMREVETIETDGSFEYIEAWAKGFDDPIDLPETLRHICK